MQFEFIIFDSMPSFSLSNTRARVKAAFPIFGRFVRRRENGEEELLHCSKKSREPIGAHGADTGVKNNGRDALGHEAVISNTISTCRQPPSRDQQIAWHRQLIKRIRHDINSMKSEYQKSYNRLDPSLRDTGRIGFLTYYVEKLDDLQLAHFGSEVVAFLELKATCIRLRGELKTALCELFLLERDPGFELDEDRTWDALRGRCEQIHAMIPGCPPWYQQ